MLPVARFAQAAVLVSEWRVRARIVQQALGAAPLLLLARRAPTVPGVIQGQVFVLRAQVVRSELLEPERALSVQRAVGVLQDQQRATSVLLARAWRALELA